MENVIANHKKIGKNVEIGPDVEITCDNISIGDGTVILGNTKILCKECIIGKNNFIKDILIEGSLNAGNTKINIGDECLIVTGTRLNCNDYLEIGDDVNMGDVQIFTHSSSMNVFMGYPFIKAPVRIGSHVWINIGSIIHPGVNIGSDVIILNNSVVNMDIPSGCLAGGTPVRIIKENCYPYELSVESKKEIIVDCIREYKELLKLKNFTAEIELLDNLNIKFNANERNTVFDCETREIHGDLDDFSEDFRDFLRYRGIKFFTGKPFSSIKPEWYMKLNDAENDRGNI